MEYCDKCGETAVRYGHDKNGRQKYRCKKCKAITTTESKKNLFKGMRKEKQRFVNVIEAIIYKNGTVQNIIKEQNISLKTYYDWRKKFYSNEKIREDVIYELTHNNKDKKNELNLLVENKVNKS